MFKKFFESNKEEVIKLQTKYKESVNWVNENPEIAADMGKEKLQLAMPAGVVKESLSKMSLTFLSANKAKDSVDNYLKELSTISKEFIGGKTPDEEFYLY